MNKRGLASSLLAVMLLMFALGFFSLLGLTMWNTVNDSIQGVDNESISQGTKDKIDDLSSFMNWGDKIFTLIFLALFVGFLVTSFTLPVNEPVFFIIYLLFLTFVSIVGMILSNAWSYLAANPNFLAAANTLVFTDWFMNYQPIIMFVIGLVGGIIFYARRSVNPSTGSGQELDFNTGDGF